MRRGHPPRRSAVLMQIVALTLWPRYLPHHIGIGARIYCRMIYHHHHINQATSPHSSRTDVGGEGPGTQGGRSALQSARVRDAPARRKKRSAPNRFIAFLSAPLRYRPYHNRE
ncbi:hypothetical protein ACJJTC_009862 [Scirpophaga incertulas]